MNDKEKDIARENLESKEGGEKQYEFITETIKKKPVNKKRILLKVIYTILLAIVFGAVASAVFAFTAPILYEKINPEKVKTVTLPVTEEAIEEPIEEFVPTEEEDELQDGQEAVEAENTDAETNADSADALADATSNKESDIDEEGKEVVINNVVETIEKDLELDDYRMLYRKISSVGNTVQKSMVRVSGLSSNTDWFNNKYEDNNSAAGVIIADNGKELLMVSLTDTLSDAEEVEVTFCDGKSYSSQIKKSDPSTGLTIVAVNLADMDEGTLDKIEMATFGSISNMTIGTPILAVGSPQGIADSAAIGQITSASVKDITDGSLKILSTDIYGSTQASGVLANLNGRVIGIICHDYSADMPNLIRAYSITDIKDKIEKISNGQDIALLGITGTDVTEAAYNEMGVPFGTFVKKVDIDSPAMNAGIRSGDVIVKIGTSEIKSFTDYKDVLLKCNPDDTIIVTVMRPGREKYFEMTYEISLGSL